MTSLDKRWTLQIKWLKFWNGLFKSRGDWWELKGLRIVRESCNERERITLTGLSYRSLKLSNLNINRNRGVNREIISLLHSQNWLRFVFLMLNNAKLFPFKANRDAIYLICNFYIGFKTWMRRHSVLLTGPRLFEHHFGSLWRSFNSFTLYTNYSWNLE